MRPCSKPLEDIGFYTLSDARAAQVSGRSPLWRCEMLLTHRCNFNCPYCRGMRADCRGDLPLHFAAWTLQHWIQEGLKNVRFSGGEPTLYDGLRDLVRMAAAGDVERIAVSTNGSSSPEYYHQLLNDGVNDFSISLDGCCAADVERMGGISRSLGNRVLNNIRWLAKKTYVTVGVVLAQQNASQVADIVRFADGLGVADIRIITAAQDDGLPLRLAEIPEDVLGRHPILRYRVENLKAGRPLRGIGLGDCERCHLAKDDMAVAGRWHFPCIIYLREGGDPIGEVGPDMRRERVEWSERTNRKEDPICSKNCLDVCVAYNNRVRDLINPSSPWSSHPASSSPPRRRRP